MKTFGSLKLGQTFTDKTGEFAFIKTRDGARGGDHGHTVRFNDDEMVDPYGDEPILHDKPTEIERAALTLLLDAWINHPGLHAWVIAMASNPDEFRWLDEYVLDPASTIETGDGTMQLAEFCRLRELVTPTKLYDRDNCMWSSIQDCEPRGKRETGIEKNVAWRDRHAFHLAMAIREYREMGRPDGDQTHTIQGMGAPLMNITTSLAAAVVEYHKQIVNQIHIEHRFGEED